MINKKYDIFTKIYLIVYSLNVFFILFMLDSQLSNMGSIKTVNIVITLLAIIINFCLTLFKNNFKFDSSDVMIEALIIVLSILPRLFEVQIISPFFAMLYLMIINAKYIDSDIFIKTDFKIRLFSIILVFLFYSLNLFEENIVVRGDALRYSMGFVNPNETGIIFLSLLLSFVLLFNKVKNNLVNNFYIVIYIIIMIVLLFYIVNITDSRELQISGIVLIVLFVCRNIKLFRYISFKSIIPIFILSLLLSIISVLLLDPNSQLFYLLNQLTTYRITNALAVFQIYPVHLFGNIDVSPLKNIILDNGQTPGTDNNYLSILCDFGIIGLSIFFMVMIKGINIVKQHKKYLVSICLISVFIIFTVSQSRDLYAPLIYAFTLNNNFRKGINYER